MDRLRERCKDVLEEQHDDIWLLRYILSRKSVDKAEPHVRKGIQWRKVCAGLFFISPVATRVS